MVFTPYQLWSFGGVVRTLWAVHKGLARLKTTKGSGWGFKRNDITQLNENGTFLWEEGIEKIIAQMNTFYK